MSGVYCVWCMCGCSAMCVLYVVCVVGGCNVCGVWCGFEWSDMCVLYVWCVVGVCGVRVV